MKVDISKVKTSESKLLVEGNLEFGTVEFDGSEFKFENVSLTGEIVNIGGSLELRANVKGGYETSCARCLKPVMSSFDADIYEDLTDEEVGELVSKNGNEWDIKELVLSDVLLELPQKVLCEDECKGLCPDCGKDLNEGPCSCVKDDWDVRFDILKNFKADL